MSNNQGSPWTNGEISFLKEHYKNMTHAEMAKHLGRTKTAVDLKLSKLGLKKSKYNYDVTYFDFIDSEDKAYWLGFIYADGYVRFVKTADYRCYELGIELQKRDYKHLKKLNNSLNGNVPVTFRTREVYWQNQNGTHNLHDMCLIRFYSKRLIEPLLKYNIANGKSFSLSFPDIPKQFYSAFIRGYFDGDGCVCVDDKKRKMIHLDFCSASKVFLKEIREVLYQSNIYSYMYHEKAYDGHYKSSSSDIYTNTYRLCIKGVSNTVNMIKYLYDDATIYLDRKYTYAYKLLNDFNLEKRSLPDYSVINSWNRERIWEG